MLILICSISFVVEYKEKTSKKFEYSIKISTFISKMIYALQKRYISIITSSARATKNTIKVS